MKINLFPYWMLVDNDKIHGSTAVVIDVLRATSTIIAGMVNRAGTIIPVESIETASRLVGHADRGAKLLAGEWKGLPIDGFDLFNSPGEFTPEKIEGKTVILSTTNGTRAIVAASKAERVIICSMNNIGAVSRTVSPEDELNIICAGNSGRLSAEDLLCAGILLKNIGAMERGARLCDTSRIALFLAEKYAENAEEFIRGTDRGRQLVDLGYESDVVHCSTLDSCRIVPEFRQGQIVL
ncbi:MAG: 2-phosphosulfolactate phosphatase [Candidatus Krumholzibacteriota bacterium]|nr:2-phosphosulfolactate phosphatase [Candidatus Krumholzibacteriota bacterium]